VHVDAVRAREIDLHRRHGVARARILAEADICGVVGRPVDIERIDLAAVRSEQRMLAVLEVVGILPHQRNDVLAHDRDRRIPVRIDDDLVDLGIDDRRLAIDLADDRGVAQHDAVILDRLDLRRRNVDHT
jgi:hypothetical protein